MSPRIRTIEELRAAASRTGAYAGCDEVEFGPEETKTFAGGPLTFPSWAAITVYRMVEGERVAFPGPKVRWLETYQTADANTDEPDSWWRRRPFGQVEKCAEAASLRRAFAEEVGQAYVQEEIGTRVEPEPKGSGLRARLEAARSPGAEGFNPEGMEGEIRSAEEPQGRRPSALHGVPGLRTGAQLMAELTLEQRAAGLETSLVSAPDAEALAEAWVRAADLRADLGLHAPERLDQLEALMAEREEALSE